MPERSWKVDRIKKIAYRFERSKRTLRQLEKFDAMIKKEGWEERLSDKKIDLRLKILYLLFTREEQKLYRVRLGPTELARRLGVVRNTIYRHIDLLEKEGYIVYRKIRPGRLRNVPMLKPSGKWFMRYVTWLFKKTNHVPNFSRLSKFWLRERPHESLFGDYAMHYIRLLPEQMRSLAELQGRQEFIEMLAGMGIYGEEVLLYIRYEGEMAPQYCGEWIRENYEKIKRLFPERKIKTLGDVEKLKDEYGVNFSEEVWKREREAELKEYRKHLGKH